MAALKIFLFGKFRMECDWLTPDSFRARKVQELFVYLLIFKERPQARESLSGLLWGDVPPEKSKKNLRQTLWRLQNILKETSQPALLVDDQWIQITIPEKCFLDTAEFERIFHSINKKHARELSTTDLQSMENAVALYKGCLLDGWYQDWCIFERERFQTMHIMLLDKLIQYCEVHHAFDSGLIYAAEILRHDRAYERTHRQMMRLHYMSGDRTQALHQYKRCTAALREDLDVEPSLRTKQLYQQIRTDTFKPPLFAIVQHVPNSTENNPAIENVLDRLEQFSDQLNQIKLEVQQEINALEEALLTRK
ncbi:MAG: hypothetical protein JEZ00_05365 [Anaerolineaceae bacterium]|nr:hypothetical protein [Anaerolineaceae bacterium]